MPLDYPLQVWNQFCHKQNIFEIGVNLFESKVRVDLFDSAESVSTFELGKDRKRLILKRSAEMNQLVISEVEKVLEDYRNDTRIYDGLIYMMYREEQNQIVSLYIGKSEKYGKSEGNLSANIKNIARDFSKFSRWGDNYAYHIGDLSAVVLGHSEIYQNLKYKKWAKALFKKYPSDQPQLRFPVKFWLKAWRSDEVGIWEEFGATNLTFLEYLLIGVASKLFPEDLLNSEGVNRTKGIADGLREIPLRKVLEPKESENGSDDRFEELCFLASKEKWCWNIYCTTCGHLHFKYSFLELAKGKSPKDADWSVTSEITNYTRTLGNIPRIFTARQKHLLLKNFKDADLACIAERCSFPDWLGYLGLVIHHLFGNFSDDKILSDKWASQLKEIVPVSSRAHQQLGLIMKSKSKLLTLNDLEICENDL